MRIKSYFFFLVNNVQLTGVGSPNELSLLRLGGSGGATADLGILGAGARAVSAGLTGGGGGGGSEGG